MPCQALETLKLADFDAVFVAGGLPSSSSLRVSSDFVAQMSSFWRTSQSTLLPGKILAVICSGGELLIDTEILQELGQMVGSPASQYEY